MNENINPTPETTTLALDELIDKILPFFDQLSLLLIDKKKEMILSETELLFLPKEKILEFHEKAKKLQFRSLDFYSQTCTISHVFTDLRAKLAAEERKANVKTKVTTPDSSTKKIAVAGLDKLSDADQQLLLAKMLARFK